MYQSINLLSHPNLPAKLETISEGKVSKLISFLIGQSRKKLKPLVNVLVLSFQAIIRLIDRNLQRGAELHNREHRESDYRYVSNFYHIRGERY